MLSIKRVFALCAAFISCLALGSCNSYIEQTEQEKPEPTPSVARPRQFRIPVDPNHSTPSEIIVPIGEIEVSRTEIRILIENQSGVNFQVGGQWEIAQFVDERWQPISFRPEIDRTIPMLDIGMLFTLFAEGIRGDGTNWYWLFGELPPGRYMFIRHYDSPELGPVYQWPREGREFLMIEFTIDEDTPISLPPQPSGIVRGRSFFPPFAPNHTVTSELVLPISQAEVSKTQIRFQAENQSEINFIYGAPWEIAKFIDGRWHPVPFRPEINAQTLEFFSVYLMFAGETKYVYVDWDWIFGELPYGRFMFIQSYFEYMPDQPFFFPIHGREFLMVEFAICEDTPITLPPQ